MLHTPLKSFKDVSRPTVTFDPQIESHRKAYYDFTKTGRWGNQPVIYEVRGVGNTPDKMRKKILDFYLSQEFSND